MSLESKINFIEEFDHQIAGIAWSLWRELGVPGTNRYHADCLVQLEELILLTAIVSRYDPRLRDEALDWCCRYHEYISVSRLRFFLKELEPEDADAFSEFAAALNAASSAKWPTSKKGPSFKFKLSGKASLAELESSSLLALRLRSLFGPGTKSDILTHFFTRNQKKFSAVDFVEIGYSKRSLMSALDHLAASGVLAATTSGNKKKYTLTNAKQLRALIGKTPKIAPPWNKIFKVIVAIRPLISKIQNHSEKTKSVLFRNCLINLEPLLPELISPILQYNSNFESDWKATVDIFKSFEQGNFLMQFEIQNPFEQIIALMLKDLYQLDDCVDGIAILFSEVQLKREEHKGIYKESYQLFLSFTTDLKRALEQFLKFPFYKMDEAIMDLVEEYQEEKLPILIEKIGEVLPSHDINSPQLAIHVYQNFSPTFDQLRQFLYTFRERLKNLYFFKTEIHLLTLATKLFKRHPVLNLFQTKSPPR